MICNLYLSVAARKIVCADPSLRYTSMLLGRSATKQQTNISPSPLLSLHYFLSIFKTCLHPHPLNLSSLASLSQQSSIVSFTLCCLRLTSVPSLHSPPRWPSGKASASRAEGPGFESRLRRDFFGVESYQ